MHIHFLVVCGKVRCAAIATQEYMSNKVDDRQFSWTDEYKWAGAVEAKIWQRRQQEEK